MKKAIALILALVLAICCAAALAEETEEREPDGQYAFHNASDLVVTRISLTDNEHVDRVAAIEPEGGLQPDEISGEIGLFLQEGEDGAQGLTLMVEFEDGQSSVFTTLHYEKVMIEILNPVDVTSGATPIAFTSYPQVGHYWFKNATGGTVTNLTISTNGTEEYSSTPEMAADAEIGIGWAIPADANKEHCLTVSFTREDGTEEKFETLSIEDVTITLLAPDAMTGATPIAFSAYPAE